MIFLISLIAAMTATAMVMSQIWHHPRSPAVTSIALLLLIGNMLIAFSFVSLVLGTLVGVAERNPVARHWPWIMGSGAVLSTLMCSALVGRMVTDQTRSATRRWLMGWTASALGSAYLIAAMVDHLTFWRTADLNGIISIDVYREAKINCSFPFLLVQEKDGGFDFRCPSLVLGDTTRQPFLPMLTYSSGHSTLLKSEIDRLVRNVSNETRRLQEQQSD